MEEFRREGRGRESGEQEESTKTREDKEKLGHFGKDGDKNTEDSGHGQETFFLINFFLAINFDLDLDLNLD